MQKFEESFEFLCKKHDELICKVEVLESDNKDLVKDNIRLKTDVEKLTNEMSILKNSLNDIEQYSRRR
jgi:cell division protein FtsB